VQAARAMTAAEANAARGKFTATAEYPFPLVLRVR
jgi:hypothetical protein